MFKTYYTLTKPGIVYGNAVTAAAGFFLASRGQVNPGLLLAMLTGLSGIIAAACVFNNYIDRGIDAKMARTKRRALATGSVSGRDALAYACTLALVGAAILAVFTNALTLAVALFGLFAYVVVYGVGKRRSQHGTIIGSLSGAVPPVVGYVAVTNRLDLGALILFVILVCWQMPHFFAIAIYRADDYAAAGIPVLPVKKGFRTTKIQMVLYTAAFILAASALTVFGYAGYTYLVVALLLGFIWLSLGLKGLTTADDQRWARGMFRFSLLVITLLSIAISVGGVLT